jgi:hypothetical protein
MSLSMEPSCVFLGKGFILPRTLCSRGEMEQDEPIAGILKLLKEV